MNFFLLFILFFLIAHFLLNSALEIINVRNLSEAIPEPFKDVLDPEEYAKSQRYLKDNTAHDLFSSFVNTAFIILFILFGGFNKVDLFARSFELSLIPTALIFAGTVYLLFWLLQLPFDVYDTFVIEERYGFNRSTVKTFVLDLFKGLMLAVVIGTPVLAALVWFFDSFGGYAALISWVVLTVIQIALTYLAPILILPLFNKYQPLEEGDLRTAIVDYAQKQNFRLQGIFVMDASKRSAKSNAFFTGWGRFKRVVLFDTLVEQHSIEEILAILAHEIGHYKNHHITKMMLVSIINMGIKLYLLSWFINNEALFAAFRMENLSIYASLFFFAILYSPVEFFLSIGLNALSRRYEYQADAFAAKTSDSKALIDALKKIVTTNLGNLTPHPWKVRLTESHPPVVQRIEALEKLS
jgi:STE24 endopeptidase